MPTQGWVVVHGSSANGRSQGTGNARYTPASDRVGRE
jgi:hypothetical protein